MTYTIEDESGNLVDNVITSDNLLKVPDNYFTNNLEPGTYYIEICNHGKVVEKRTVTKKGKN